MSGEGNIHGGDPRDENEETAEDAVDEEHGAMEDEDDSDDERRLVLQLLGNFVDNIVIDLEEDDDDGEDDEEEEQGEELSGAEGGGGGAGEGEGRKDYDKGLPSKHLYLGDNVEEVRGHHLMPDDYEEIEIPLFPERNFALVPGQVIPLTVFDPVYISLFKRLIDEKKDFGVRFSESTPYGTIAQIFEYCPEATYQAGISIKARGCQRFKVVSVRTTCNGVKFATVKILPEVALPKPMFSARLKSLNKLRLEPVVSTKHDEEEEEEETEGEGERKKRRTVAPARSTISMVDRMEAACSPWPAWVYKMYDEKKLAERVTESIPGTSYVAQNRKKFLQTSGNMPKDPTELSHWVARSLPFPEPERIVLLQFNSCIQRLRYELSLTAIDKFRTLGCAVCGREIAKQGDIIFMSEDGPQGVFVNMGGYVHDILTFSKLSDRMKLRGSAETQFSWFPGYSWRIGECQGCRGHVGWKFEATEKSLVPAKFFAVLKNKISWSMNPAEDVTGVFHPHS